MSTYPPSISIDETPLVVGAASVSGFAILCFAIVMWLLLRKNGLKGLLHGTK